MIDNLCQEIKQHWKTGDHSFVSKENYHGSKIKIKFDQFKDESETIFAIAMELSRSDGHSSQQDLTMGTQDKLEKFLSSPDFPTLVEKRLDTLHEAIEEMYD
ncbi:hypothetical protein ACJVC5_08295 [Peredibacter sp. HCB2-198]|uniref:hypothetical protein n=1 Tax=Peredibacter sp. HCB2-198 TaxID=3383025 RepID=UPI0038B4BC79